MPLSRRTFLRASGVTLALPFLDAMTPIGKRAKATAVKKAARRLVCYYVPNGVNNAKWIPKADLPP